MYYSSIFVSAVLSALTMPIIIGFARKNKLYDATGGRKIHSGKIPRLGGVGMFWAFFIALCVFALLGSRSGFTIFAGRLEKLVPLALGAAVMHFLGLADDIKNLPARRKFIVQSIAALFVVASGFRFRSFGYSRELFSGPMDWLSCLVSWGWIVGITNAFNLIDGMDGLAGGLSAIAAIAFSGFYLIEGDLPNAFICLTLAGVCIGFLCVNFPAPKAKLFMGDSGSLFLGFALSVMPFLGQSAANPASATAAGGGSVGLLPAIALLAIPLIDTLRAIVRRKRAGLSIGTADRKHIHHLLLDHGYTPLQILNIVYFIALIQASVFLVAFTMPAILSYAFTLLSLAIVGAFFIYSMRLSPKET